MLIRKNSIRIITRSCDIVSFDRCSKGEFQSTIPDLSPLRLPAPDASQLKIFLDMDGVLTDFNGACEQIEPNMMTWYRCDKDRFWKRVTDAGVSFWSDMSWIPGGRELYAHLKASSFPLSILSALPFPERREALANARAGKIEWLRRELGEAYAKDAILCQRTEKALHSGPTRVLIDDNFKNISEWEDAGGIGVLHKNTDRTIWNLSRIIENEYKL